LDEKENKMQILCNVSLLLAGKKSAKAIKLASIDVTQRIRAISNGLDDLDESSIEVCSQVVKEFAVEYGLNRTTLTSSITVRVWVSRADSPGGILGFSSSGTRRPWRLGLPACLGEGLGR